MDTRRPFSAASWFLLRRTLTALALVVSATASGQAPAAVPSAPTAVVPAAATTGPIVGVLLESSDPAIDPDAVRAELAAGVGVRVATVVSPDDAILTVVGKVGPEGAAMILFLVQGGPTETFMVARGEDGWLSRWLNAQVAGRLESGPVLLGWTGSPVARRARQRTLLLEWRDSRSAELLDVDFVEWGDSSTEGGLGLARPPQSR